MSTERRTQLLHRFRRVLIFNLFSLIFIGLAGGAVLTSSALQPVRRLADTVRGILRTGRTEARVPAQNTGDALDELSSLVNAMLDRIDAVLAGMRGALDNVAHDLRTPMTRLRGIAETALRSDDPVALREALADCLEESDRVVAMLSTLMDISEAETGTMALRREPTDLNDLIRQTVEMYEDVADERGVRIETATTPELVGQRRSQPSAPGARQPARQRHQIHAVRGPDRNARRPGSGCRRRKGEGHRCGHSR